MFVEAYGGNAALRLAQCYRWFENFQNGDFDVRNKERGIPAKNFEDAELQALLDEDDGQTQEHLAEQLNVDQSTVSRRFKAMSKIIKVRSWVPHELTDRRKENQKNHPSDSTANPNSFGRKTLLCIFWNQERPIYIYNELLKLGETINTDHYKQQLLNSKEFILEKHEQSKKRQHNVILLEDNAPSHRAKPTKVIVKALGWELLAHAAYSPDLAPSDYHLFSSLGHALAD
ncbi:mariner Mos1 transposase [Trichonephila clavipes]|nr:mariner Mos1 transposase [Trichonephila clavipes]